MENGFKLRISRMLRSSFSSCRPKTTTDVIERPVYVATDHQHRQLIEVLSPKHPPFPSISISKSPQSFHTHQKSYNAGNNNLSPRTKLCGQRALLPAPHDVEGQKCPPVSPILPFKQNLGAKKRSKRKVRSRSRSFGLHEFPALSYKGLFSSDEDSQEEEEEEDDDDKTTLFSSRSLSSDSSELSLRRRKDRRIKKTRNRTERSDKKTFPSRELPEGKRVENGGYAVVKRSNDPYSDFMSSMVEMIMEKQIFAAEDLKKLLQCFLSLNSDRHHSIIIQVFKEIWDALYSNCL